MDVDAVILSSCFGYGTSYNQVNTQLLLWSTAEDQVLKEILRMEISQEVIHLFIIFVLYVERSENLLL